MAPATVGRRRTHRSRRTACRAGNPREAQPPLTPSAPQAVAHPRRENSVNCYPVSPNTVLANALTHAEDVLTPRVVGSTPERVVFVVGTQINGAPHIGSSLVQSLTFATAARLRKRFGIPVEDRRRLPRPGHAVPQPREGARRHGRARHAARDGQGRRLGVRLATGRRRLTVRGPRPRPTPGPALLPAGRHRDRRQAVQVTHPRRPRQLARRGGPLDARHPGVARLADRVRRPAHRPGPGTARRSAPLLPRVLRRGTRPDDDPTRTSS